MGAKAAVSTSCRPRCRCSAAENQAVLGQTRRRPAMLDEARRPSPARQMGAGWIGARLNYLTATGRTTSRSEVAEGDTALAAAMNYMRHGSFWLFQIGSGRPALHRPAGRRRGRAMDLLASVLRDPQPADWVADPMEVAGRAGHAASAAAGALVRSGHGTARTTNGLGDRRPRPAASLFHHPAPRRTVRSRCGGCSKGPGEILSRLAHLERQDF